ncbi:ATP-binding cassette domain-containing protein, partial [Candidatus Gracilibacteria bacterium]|nr:ATP-binding cassette domain-containing protein [Candidatus Gracilibacteria bacterium]
MLKINKINLKIGEKKILNDISFEVKKGEIFNILGHNGSGKTSLLKSIIGLNKVNGEIFFDGENISKLDISEKSEKGISYIMQEIPEYTGISIKNYIKKILEKNGKKIDDEKIFFELKNFFTNFGLDFEKYQERYFDSHLSGGERKKIEIITNFLMDKKFYLLDEIEASLDATSRDVLIKIIKEKN